MTQRRRYCVVVLLKQGTLCSACGDPRAELPPASADLLQWRARGSVRKCELLRGVLLQRHAALPELVPVRTNPKSRAVSRNGRVQRARDCWRYSRACVPFPERFRMDPRGARVWFFVRMAWIIFSPGGAVHFGTRAVDFVTPFKNVWKTSNRTDALSAIRLLILLQLHGQCISTAAEPVP
jgi:hypothetical protein